MTFLTTRRMHPDLARRVSASVSGRKGPARARRTVALARLVILLTAGFALHNFLSIRRQSERDLETKRAAILETVQAHAAGLTPGDTALLGRAEAAVARLARKAYEGDVVDGELRASPGALERVVARRAIYVRGPRESLEAPADVARASAASAKDALLVCLLDPPKERTERAMLEKQRAVLAGGAALEGRTTNVRRLHDAEAGLPFLLPAWSDRVRRSEDAAELAALAKDLERAPLVRAREALRAELLIVAIDEKGDSAGPTELDGERAHDVRLALIDLTTAAPRPLLRVRRRVDPSWISASKRPLHASALDGCGLALDVHEATRR